MGYFGIGIENGKTVSNVGTLWRSANIFGAQFIFTIGKRYRHQTSDTMITPRHIPLFHYDTFEAFYEHLPHDCQLIGVELVEGSVSLPDFKHPKRAAYILGAEDYGLSAVGMSKCHQIIQLPTVKESCLNVSAVGSIVLYDRLAKSKETT